MNHFRMTELIPDIHDQIAQGYQPFSIMSNLLLSYCRTGNINNRTDYSGEYMDTPVVQEIGISLPDFISRQSKSNFS